MTYLRNCLLRARNWSLVVDETLESSRQKAVGTGRNRAQVEGAACSHSAR